MRDMVFLVADGSMEQLLRGFFTHDAPHRRLACGPFVIDPTREIIVAPGRDPEVYGRADQLLRPFCTTHARAVVMLDSAWEGSPGSDKIRERIAGRMRHAWQQFAVIVIDPELEAWVWQENPHVASALGCPANFRDILESSGHWPAGPPKPIDPKAALEHLRNHHRADRSKAVFHRVAAKISVRNCADTAFQQLRDTFRDWFPEETL